MLSGRSDGNIGLSYFSFESCSHITYTWQQHNQKQWSTHRSWLSLKLLFLVLHYTFLYHKMLQMKFTVFLGP
jgi:hypothetical protein